MTHTEKSNSINWNIVNWLRGLAALYVVINHCRGALFSNSMMYAENVNPKENWSWWEWVLVTIMNHTSLGSEFVIFFFVLSGFSIAHSLRDNNTDIKMFYKRRLARLYPPYILGIAWAFVAYLMVVIFVPQVFYTAMENHPPLKTHYDMIAKPFTLFLNLIYVPKDNLLTHQYWSLPFEVVFYFLAPWMIKHLRVWGIGLFITYLIGWVVYGKAYHNPDYTNTLFQFTIEYGVYFIAGILMYKYKDRIINSFKLSMPLAVLAALAIFESLVILKGYTFGGEHNKITGILAMMLVYVLLFAALKYNIRINWLEKVGAYSYTLYVTHWATIYIIKIIAVKLGYNYYYIHNLFIWQMGVFICLGTSYLLYLVAEKPSSKYIDKLRKPAQAKPVVHEPVHENTQMPHTVPA